MRGQKNIEIFAREMLATLNMEKNAIKPHWSSMSLYDLTRKLGEEFAEVVEQVANLNDGDRKAAAELMLECADLANMAMMLRDHAEKILVEDAVKIEVIA